MKTKILFFALLCLPFLGSAQENTKQKEVGLVFSGLNSFGLTYRVGNAPYLWRFRTLYTSGEDTKETGPHMSNHRKLLGGSISIGREKRKELIENLEFRYGADIHFGIFHEKIDYEYTFTTPNYTSSSYTYSDRMVYEPGINAVIGLNYIIKDHLVIGAELLPSFTYVTGKSYNKNFIDDSKEKNKISGFRYGFSNGSALLSLVYRF